MTASLHSITFDCTDAAKLATFWAGVLDRSVHEGATEDFAALGPEGASAESPNWMFVKVPETKTAKNRLHCDLGAADLEAEVRRLQELGANKKAAFDEHGHRWVTMLDPEGNEFDVVAATP